MTTATKSAPSPTWDLDSIFPGGSSSKEFESFRSKVKADLESLEGDMSRLPESIDKDSVSAWVDTVMKLQDLSDRIGLVQSLAGCLTAQNVKDNPAHAIDAEGSQLVSSWLKLKVSLEAASLKQSDEQWSLLTDQSQIKEIAFYLNELRDQARDKMSMEQESLVLDLAVDGYHAWNKIYDKMAGDLTVDIEENGGITTLSLGQVATRYSSADRSVRETAFRKMVQAWESRADLAAMALNAQAGFRLTLYRRRNWKSVVAEPLKIARLKEESLNTMWRVIERESKQLGKYIEAKKKLLGIDNFSIWDEMAPCGAVDRRFDFAEAREFIVQNTRPFSKDMADFFEMALDKRWVEAEDRANKAGGGFCTGMGPFKQTRIFMTYAGTFDNLLTLAHELGHAYHGWVLKDRPPFAAEYPMTLAETASIFAETLVIDAALEQASDRDEKLMLLDQKIQAAMVLFMNIYSRYLFERAFYEERARGMVSTERLCELMIEAQKRAYHNLLDRDGYHKLFWCSKLHFYITDVPFYNYPYTVGYLFAGGVYDRAKGEGSAFADGYRALLADTGSMTTEDVARKHLGVDLAGEEFWTAAVKRSLSDIDKFVKLVG